MAVNVSEFGLGHPSSKRFALRKASFPRVESDTLIIPKTGWAKELLRILVDFSVRTKIRTQKKSPKKKMLRWGFFWGFFVFSKDEAENEWSELKKNLFK